MNCLEWRAHWQDALDERVSGGGDDWLAHLKECPACRELHDSAARMLSALAAAAHPPPPANFADRVLAAVRAGKRQQWQRRWLGVAGLAAAALVLWGVARLFVSLPGAGPGASAEHAQNGLGPRTSSQPEIGVRPPTSPSLEAQLADAGSATVDMTKRLARDTMRQAALFVPPLDDGAGSLRIRWPGLEPMGGADAVQAVPVQQVSRSVADSLEPVTSSTRRAFNMFWRLLPPTEIDKPRS
jgi:hypothetical protein